MRKPDPSKCVICGEQSQETVSLYSVDKELKSLIRRAFADMYADEHRVPFCLHHAIIHRRGNMKGTI
jgi:hypothetical protein